MIRHLTDRLLHLYPYNEAKAIVLMLLDDYFGISLTDICCGSLEKMPQQEREQLEQMMCRLENAEPVQYVIGHAMFGRRKFHVTRHVLIPRPETEQLCRIVEKEIMESAEILDIGTGSGCIAITLALYKPDSHVSGWDISPEALQTAKENALRLGAEINFSIKDALHLTPEESRWDIIVSNPPYVCRSEARNMERHVLEYEPETALFVEDEDPLCFYKSIGHYAVSALKYGGLLFFEVNTALVNETASLLSSMGLSDVRTMNDEFGRPRFVSARRL